MPGNGEQYEQIKQIKETPKKLEAIIGEIENFEKETKKNITEISNSIKELKKILNDLLPDDQKKFSKEIFAIEKEMVDILELLQTEKKLNNKDIQINPGLLGLPSKSNKTRIKTHTGRNDALFFASEKAKESHNQNSGKTNLTISYKDQEEYQKAKTEHDKLINDYHKQTDAYIAWNKMLNYTIQQSNNAENNELTIQKNNQDRYKKLSPAAINTKQIQDEVNRRNENSFKAMIEHTRLNQKLYKKYIYVYCWGVSDHGTYPQAKKTITINDIKNRTIGFDKTAGKANTNYKTMEAAIKHYESLGLMFDHFEAKINGDNVAMIYMPVFKQPIEPNISIPEYKKLNNDYSFEDTYEPIPLAPTNLKFTKKMNTPMGYFESYNEQKGFYEKKILTVADFIQLPQNIQDKYIPGAQAWREIIAKIFPDLNKNLYANTQ